MTLTIARILLVLAIALEVLIIVQGPQPAEHLKEIDEALRLEKKPDWWDDAALGVHYAAWVNVALLGVALITAKWWVFSNAAAQKTAPLGQLHSVIPRYFWPLLFMAVVVCVGVRLPLASKSLWWDESWSLLQASHGRWRPDPKEPNQLRFQAHDWKRAAWYYQKPTNHAPMSLAQKLVQNGWRKVTRAERSEFSDLAARVPALIASGVAVVLMGTLLSSWGRPGAGVAAAFLLALHPWLLRYGVDARGYAFVIPLSIGALLSLTRILQTKGEAIWPWVGFAITEFLWLWAWPYAAFDLVVLNAALMILLLPMVAKSDRWRVFFRIVVVNLFAAVCFIQLFLPNAMQMLRWVGQETVSQPFSLPLAKSLFSQMILGVEHSWPAGVESAGLPSSHLGVPPWGYTLSILTPMAIVVLALAWLARKDFGSLGRAPWLILSVPLIGAALFIGVSALTGTYFYPRFVISSVPVVIAAVCLVFYQKPRSKKSIASGLWNPRWVLAVMLLAAISSFWWAQLQVYFSRPYAPLHDVVSFLEKKTSDVSPTPIVACFGHGREVMPLYAPHMRGLESLEDIQAVMEEAKREQRSLYVVFGHPFFNRGTSPEAMALLADTTRFQDIGAFNAIEYEFFYRILKAL